ncbi:MAG: NUDIX hydrolase, partial [Solirubrobacteraceae bacterium]
MSFPPGILARGPWQRGQVSVRWREDSFEPDADQAAAADRAIAELQDRGSPAHDGLAARLC